MKRFLLLLATCFLPSAHAAAEALTEDSDFIRVREDDTGTHLETAVTRFEKDGFSVELIGAIHIADAAYYEALNKRFAEYDALLFEGIGGGSPFEELLDEAGEEEVVEALGDSGEVEVLAEPEAGEEELEELGEEEPEVNEAEVEMIQAAPLPAEKPGRLDRLHKIYGKGADWLDLAYQMEEIDYGRANFVHADLSMREFRVLQAERKESILGFALKAGMSSTPAAKEPSTFGMLKALVKRDKNAMKRQLVHTLGAGDEQMAGIEGENVIVTDRNAKCLRVLEAQVAAGKRNLAIFYGAAHFPDMEKRLIEAGWAKTGEEWLTAWEIGN